MRTRLIRWPIPSPFVSPFALALRSGVEVVNCKSVQVHINGTVPGLQADKTDGLEVYTSEKRWEVRLGLTVALENPHARTPSLPAAWDSRSPITSAPTSI